MERLHPAMQSFEQQDHAFVALVEGAFADATARSGAHLLCRPGCAQCCIGVFAIGPADALRLQQGLMRLEAGDPDCAARVRARVAASWERLAPHFPGDPVSGVLAVDANGEFENSFDDFANQERCPVLDPDQGICDLYPARPHTCRVFGPPVETPEGYGVCELCFHAATPAEIAAAVLTTQPAALDEALDRAATHAGAHPGATVIAYALSPTLHI